MDFAYTSEQEELRGLAKEIFASADDTGRLPGIEAEPEWIDRDLWKRLADSNLLGVTVPEADGGLGFGLLEACLVAEQCGRTLGHVPLIPTVVGGVLPLVRWANDELRHRMLSGVLSGDTIFTMALTELPDAPMARGRRTGEGWVLEGQKAFVPYGHLADAFVVSASGDEGGGLFLVDRRAEGVTLERQTTMSGDPQFLLDLEAVPATVLAAPGDQGDEAVHWLLQRSQVAYCAMELGIAEAALRMTARYTTERVQFERPIATFQAVGHRMADCYIDVLAMRWTMLEAAARLDAGEPADEAVYTAKWWACEAGHRVISAAQHCHGGVGVDMSYPLYRYFLWSKQIEVTLGSASEQLAELGRQIAAITTDQADAAPA